MSVYLYVCIMCVCRQKTVAVLTLENRHEIALYRSASQFIFFERCLQSRTSLLSSAMAMVSNSCTAPRGYRTLRELGVSAHDEPERAHGENFSKLCTVDFSSVRTSRIAYSVWCLTRCVTRVAIHPFLHVWTVVGRG